MKKIVFLLLFIITSCNSSKNNASNAKDVLPNQPLLTVIKIQNGKDGYTATLQDSKKGLYICTISIPNLEDNYVNLEVNDKVKIAGDYLESDPVQIIAKRIVKIE